jgi:hypothetical protein
MVLVVVGDGGGKAEPDVDTLLLLERAADQAQGMREAAGAAAEAVAAVLCPPAVELVLPGNIVEERFREWGRLGGDGQRCVCVCGGGGG